MFSNLLKFEYLILLRNKAGYVLLFCFLVLGLLIGLKANFPFPNTVKNGTYVLNYMIGILSLLSIFSTTLMAAQLLFRENDARFEPILYATPIRKFPYVLSRFAAIFGMGLLCYLLLLCGLITGQLLDAKNNSDFGVFRFSNYLNPFFILLLPNIFFCTAVACGIGLLSRNKMLVYVSGIFIYFLYWGISFLTNSPLIANSTPMSGEKMLWAAIADPFGMAAFFEQTYYWTAIQRNNQLLHLSGHLLLNRLIYLVISLLLFYSAYRRFVFTTGQQKGAKEHMVDGGGLATAVYIPAPTRTGTLAYAVQCLWSLLKIEFRNIITGIPLWIVLTGWLGFFSIETLSDLGGNSRIPEQLATTAVIVKNVLSAFPLVALLVVVYYARETYGRSRSCGFDQLEQTSPLSPLVTLCADWLTLILVVLLLLGATIFAGVAIQLLKGYAGIDGALYISLFYLVGLPLALNAGLVMGILVIVKNRYAGIAIAGIVVLLCNTALGSILSINHPLLKYANAFNGTYSALNGFGRDLIAFHYKMIYGSGITGLILILSAKLRYKNHSGAGWFTARNAVLLLSVTAALGAGYVLFNKTETRESRTAINDHKQAYEYKYALLKKRPQPVITDVNAQIDLYPSTESYQVKGTYILVNKTGQAIDSLFVYGDDAVTWGLRILDKGELVRTDTAYGYTIFKMGKSLYPGDSARLAFTFQFTGDPFNAAEPFNTMIGNGSFIRISRYFPGLGYNSDLEIGDREERNRRKLKPKDDLLPLDALRQEHSDFITFDLTLSTDVNQTAIGIGTLIRDWQEGGRHYSRYRSPSPAPFRFAVASGRYAVKKVMKNNLPILVYYHPGHKENIDHLAETAVQSLDYFERNFSPYPYPELRFVEISAFTSGFAGTAYPATLFINESFGYQRKIEGNPSKDILNEMVSHELSHTWWGNAGIAPDHREGSLLMTETLAMYAELMAYKNVYGAQYLRERVNVHKSIYLSNRSFANEPPLIRLEPEMPYLAYNKGMVVMYQLYQYLGEYNINRALRNFYTRYTYPLVPVATDLLQEFYAVAPAADTAKIRELFEQVVTYDLKLNRVEARKNKDGTYTLTLNGDIEKYLEDGKGRSVLIPFREDLDVDVSFKDGTWKRLVLKPTDNKVRSVLSYVKEPVSVILDPDGKLLTRNDEQKEKKANLR